MKGLQKKKGNGHDALNAEGKKLPAEMIDVCLTDASFEKKQESNGIVSKGYSHHRAP